MSIDDKDDDKTSEEALKKAETTLEVEQDARSGKVKAEAKAQDAVTSDKGLNQDG